MIRRLIALGVFSLVCIEVSVADDAPLLGMEVVPADEAANIEKVKAKILGDLKKSGDLKPTQTLPRDVHAKATCVKAEFSVESGLSPDLAVGIFKAPKKYAAWIRYSNGSGDPQKSDIDSRARGMAIKLTGVDGAKLLSGPGSETKTQDFIFINFPGFFMRNVADYVSLFESPVRYFGGHLFPAGVNGLKLKRAKLSNPLQTRFFSMVPYRFGDEAKHVAVKYSALPVPCGSEKMIATPVKKDPNSSSLAIQDTLRSGDACFKFQVQRQTSATQMPIEDAAQIWSEDESPFVTVANIRISKLANDGFLGTQNKARTDFCENLSMNPWHALPEHRPLGGINRARKVVYQTISGFRHERNAAPTAEPTGQEAF